MDIKYTLHIKLNQYLLNKESPNMIIEFIYRNIYKLINEIPFVPADYHPNDLNEQLIFAYNFYYKRVIKKSEEKYLLTLFPDPDLSYYCSFKKMYIGLVGRLHFFSDNLSDYYFYGDPMNWHISNNINNENKALHLKSCIFGLINTYSEFQVEDLFGDIINPDYGFIICKKEINFLLNKDYKVGHYEDRDVKKMLNMYKENYLLNYKPEVGKLWEIHCINNFLSKSINTVYGGSYRL